MLDVRNGADRSQTPVVQLIMSWSENSVDAANRWLVYMAGVRSLHGLAYPSPRGGLAAPTAGVLPHARRPGRHGATGRVHGNRCCAGHADPKAELQAREASWPHRSKGPMTAARMLRRPF